MTLDQLIKSNLIHEPGTLKDRAFQFACRLVRRFPAMDEREAVSAFHKVLRMSRLRFRDAIPETDAKATKLFRKAFGTVRKNGASNRSDEFKPLIQARARELLPAVRERLPGLEKRRRLGLIYRTIAVAVALSERNDVFILSQRDLAKMIGGCDHKAAGKCLKALCNINYLEKTFSGLQAKPSKDGRGGLAAKFRLPEQIREMFIPTSRHPGTGSKVSKFLEESPLGPHIYEGEGEGFVGDSGYGCVVCGDVDRNCGGCGGVDDDASGVAPRSGGSFDDNLFVPGRLIESSEYRDQNQLDEVVDRIRTSFRLLNRAQGLMNVDTGCMDVPADYRYCPVNGKFYQKGEGLNFQNMNKLERERYAADVGRLIVRGDFKQAEPRIGADQVGCLRLRRDLESGDFYQSIAATAGVELKTAKEAVIAMFNGARVLEANPDGAKVLEVMRQRYPRISQWAGEVASMACRDGFVRSASGRLLPVRKRRQAMNAVVAATLADVMDDVRAWVLSQCHLGIDLAVDMHDELVLLVPESLAAQTARALSETMKSAWRRFVTSVQPDVSLHIESKWSLCDRDDLITR